MGVGVISILDVAAASIADVRALSITDGLDTGRLAVLTSGGRVEVGLVVGEGV